MLKILFVLFAFTAATAFAQTPASIESELLVHLADVAKYGSYGPSPIASTVSTLNGSLDRPVKDANHLAKSGFRSKISRSYLIPPRKDLELKRYG
jgi:hypothetical protein